MSASPVKLSTIKHLTIDIVTRSFKDQ